MLVSNSGGYSYDGADYPMHPTHGSMALNGGGSFGLPPLHPGTHRHTRSESRARPPATRHVSKASRDTSVRFQDEVDEDEETRSVISTFEHRCACLSQGGT